MSKTPTLWRFDACTGHASQPYNSIMVQVNESTFYTSSWDWSFDVIVESAEDCRKRSMLRWWLIFKAPFPILREWKSSKKAFQWAWNQPMSLWLLTLYFAFWQPQPQGKFIAMHKSFMRPQLTLKMTEIALRYVDVTIFFLSFLSIGERN